MIVPNFREFLIQKYTLYCDTVCILTSNYFVFMMRISLKSFGKDK